MFLLLEVFFFFELRYFLVNLKQIIKIYKRLYSYKYIKISSVDLTILLAINKKLSLLLIIKTDRFIISCSYLRLGGG